MFSLAEIVVQGELMHMFHSLRGRLIAVFLLVALSAMGVIGFFALSRSSRAIMDATWKEGDARASELALRVNAYLEERLSVVAMQAERYTVRSMQWEEQEPALLPLYDRYGFPDVFVADRDGVARFVGKKVEGVNVKDREYFRTVWEDKKPFVSNPLVNRTTGELTFVYAAPIMKDGKIQGVLVAAEKLEYIAKGVAAVQWGGGATVTSLMPGEVSWLIR